jgi:hypothetical protein
MFQLFQSFHLVCSRHSSGSTASLTNYCGPFQTFKTFNPPDRVRGPFKTFNSESDALSLQNTISWDDNAETAEI